jgi:formate--tetrahydrofolate ligase
MSDLDIAQRAILKPIIKLAEERLGIGEDHLDAYGRFKAKLSLEYIDTLKERPSGKLILVTAISPTPAGEGKTTTTVGLGDALNRLGKKAMICLREPALGPCFGVKGGAAAMLRSCPWKTSTCISRATFMPSAPLTTCLRR